MEGICKRKRLWNYVIFKLMQTMNLLSGCFLKIAYNVLRVGDVASCCACGKAILLTRCCSQFVFNKISLGQSHKPRYYL